MAEQPSSKQLSSGPWKVAIGVSEAMKNWLVASLGMCRDHGDEVIYVTTDHVHASDAVCYPYEDAEFIVRCRNFALEHGDPLELIERLRMAERLNVETVARLQQERDVLAAELDLAKASARNNMEFAMRTTPPPKDARLERLEAFKDMILAGCTEELYCGPHPNDLWSTLSGECQPCKGSGVVRDANDKIVDCAVCRSTGVAPTKAEPPSDALLRRCYNELPNPEHEADFDKRQRLRDLFQDLVKAIQWPPPTKEGDGYGHCPECRAVPGTCVHSAGETPAPRTCFFCGSTEHSEVSDSPGAIVTRTTGCPVHDGQGEGYGPSASEEERL